MPAQRVVVIGGGRIGLPLALTAAGAGHRTTVLEADAARVGAIMTATPPFDEPGMPEAMTELRESGHIDATLDRAILRQADVVLCAIGTGMTPLGEPDLSGLEALVDTIAEHLQPGVLVVFKTTLPLGTTERMADRLSKAAGLPPDQDLLVCFSPERIVEGRAMSEMKRLPKIIGGIGPRSQAAGEAFFSTIGGDIVAVSGARTAELCKLLDNAYRMTRFGFASDVATVARAHGIDAYEAITAANHDYGRNSIPLPSMGVSGYCLTKDPRYLDAGAADLKQRAFPSTWMAARRAADDQLERAAHDIVAHLASNPEDTGSVSGRVVIAGLTYKEDVEDTRESHGLVLAKLLQGHGCEVVGWDPLLPVADIEGIPNHTDAALALAGAEIVAFTVPHAAFRQLAADDARLAAALQPMATKRIYDGWGIFRLSTLPPGTLYEGTGLAPRTSE